MADRSGKRATSASPPPNTNEKRRRQSERERLLSDSEKRASLTSDVPIYRLVLTGGPCAGKTSAMARLRGYLESRGFRVFVVPEAATLLFNGGLSVRHSRSQWSRQSVCSAPHYCTTVRS